MKTVLFIILPYPSHYIASFSFANEWSNAGYKVIYTGPENLRELIQFEGFEYHEFQYFEEYVITTFKNFFGLFLKTISDNEFIKIRYKHFYYAQLAVENLVSLFCPQTIFVDEHLSEYTIFLKKYNAEIRILCTKLSSRKARGIPPMNSNYVPNGGGFSAIICEALWLRHWISVNWKNQILKIAFCWKDDRYFLKRYCLKYGYNFKKMIDERNFFIAGRNELAREILGTPKLDFNWRKKFQDETYHFLPIKRNEDKYKTTEYGKLIEFIKINDKLKVVFCSFGTVGSKEPNTIAIFIKKLLLEIPKDLNLLMVISKGKLSLDLQPNPNIYIFDFLPQLDFLRYCNVMITHGGHNSIKECLQAGVKMLVYPLMDDFDQRGNAVRVECNKYGLMGDIEKDTPKDIWNKLNYLLSATDDKEKEQLQIYKD